MRFLRLQYDNEPFMGRENNTVTKETWFEITTWWFENGGPIYGRLQASAQSAPLEQLTLTRSMVPLEAILMADIIVCKDRVLKSRW